MASISHFHPRPVVAARCTLTVGSYYVCLNGGDGRYSEPCDRSASQESQFTQLEVGVGRLVNGKPARIPEDENFFDGSPFEEYTEYYGADLLQYFPTEKLGELIAWLLAKK